VDARPTDFDGIIGQDDAKLLLSIAIKSAKQRGESIGHICMSGQAGAGKTTFARAVANEYGSNIRLLNGANISTFNKLTVVLDNLDKGDILFIDEIHRINKKIMENMYTVMEDFRYDSVIGSVSVKQFTLIGATTHIGLLTPMLRDRFVNFIELVPYNITEMTEIVKRVSKIYGLTLGTDEAKFVARTCRGVPRVAVNRMSFLRDFIIVNVKKPRITAEESKEIIKQALKLQGVDEYGLTNNDWRYLSLLYKDQNGATALKNIASQLNLTEVNVLTQIEPYLMQLGLISIQRPHGRILNRQLYKDLLEAKNAGQKK
jgi:Holliday junction DNA helicase RuvB